MLELNRPDPNKPYLSEEDQKKNLEHVLLSLILNVDGISDKELIKEWLHELPQNLTKQINDKIVQIQDWGVNTTHKCTCKDCGQEFEIDIPINSVNFFTE